MSDLFTLHTAARGEGGGTYPVQGGTGPTQTPARLPRPRPPPSLEKDAKSALGDVFVKIFSPSAM